MHGVNLLRRSQGCLLAEREFRPQIMGSASSMPEREAEETNPLLARPIRDFAQVSLSWGRFQAELRLNSPCL